MKFNKRKLNLIIYFLVIILILLPSTLGLFIEKNAILKTQKIVNIDKKIEIISVNELKAGDIVFKHPEAFRGPIIIDHCLLCCGYDNLTDTYEFIEAHFHYGVQSRFEKKENLTRMEWGPFARVWSANEEQKKNAIDFARKQIGRDFQIEWINKNYNPTDVMNDSLAIEWYCSELIWAAYYNCNNKFPENLDEKSCKYGDGIDLDLNGWKKILNISIVAPREILYDSDVIRLLIDFKGKSCVFTFLDRLFFEIKNLSEIKY